MTWYAKVTCLMQYFMLFLYLICKKKKNRVYIIFQCLKKTIILYSNILSYHTSNKRENMLFPILFYLVLY